MIKNMLIVLLITIILVGVIDKANACPPEKTATRIYLDQLAKENREYDFISKQLEKLEKDFPKVRTTTSTVHEVKDRTRVRKSQR